MKLNVNIFSHSFTLACEDDQEALLRQAATELNQKIFEAKAAMPKLSNEDLFILVALEYCQQNLHFKQQTLEKESAQEIVAAMLGKVQHTLDAQ